MANPQPADAATPPSRLTAVLVALGALFLLVAVARLFVGTTSIGWPTGEYADTILHWRQNRLLGASVAGVALAVSGVALQTLLRNPLAEPYILGLSTGAAAGIMAQALLFWAVGLSTGATHLGALLGAAASMAIVFLASRRRGIIDPLGLLLTGVVLSTINGAVIMLLNYLVGPGGLRDDLARWMMGYLNENLGVIWLGVITGLTALGFVVLLLEARALDIATLSEIEASSLGVNMAWIRSLLFLVASVLAAGAVVLAGPIAFVGLICPHLARLLLGPAHAPLLVASALLGATLLVLADITSSVIAQQLGIGVVPLGVFTAMLGGPAFLWMLRPQLGRGLE